MLPREVPIGDRHHARDVTARRENAQLVSFVELIPQRVRGRTGAMESDIALIGNAADHKRRHVHRTGDHAPRRSTAHAFHEIAHVVARPPGEHGAQRVEGVGFATGRCGQGDPPGDGFGDLPISGRRGLRANGCGGDTTGAGQQRGRERAIHKASRRKR